MSANDQHSRIPDRTPPNGIDEMRSGAGAASAMERMKAERAVRLNHQHGIPAAVPRLEEKRAVSS